MRYKPLYLIVWTVACVALAGHGPLAEAQEDAGSEVQADTPNPMTIPAGYRYDPAGRRDPFTNPVPSQLEAVRAPEVRPPGLPGVLLNEASLNAIVLSANPQMSAVVIGAPGDRVFIAHTGDEMYDVVIREIRLSDVVFEVKPLEGDDPLAPRALVARALTQEND